MGKHSLVVEVSLCGSSAVELCVRHSPRVFLAVHQFSEPKVCSLRLAGVFSKVTDRDLCFVICCAVDMLPHSYLSK